MADFKVINTQEEFDAAIQQRLDRERAKYSDYETLQEKARRYDELAAKDYEKTLADVRSQLNAANGKVKELTGRAEQAEAQLLKGRVAHEYRLPFELADRLSGSTEDELRKDAETLSRYMGQARTAPLASTEPVAEDANKAALRTALHNLNLTGGN